MEVRLKNVSIEASNASDLRRLQRLEFSQVSKSMRPPAQTCLAPSIPGFKLLFEKLGCRVKDSSRNFRSRHAGQNDPTLVRLL